MGQAISSSQFFLYGKRHFTETGYLRNVQKYTEPVQKAAAVVDMSDGVDLSGRVIVVTGANSGVGKEIATYCAAHGAKKVYMMCRSKDKANAAREEILQATTQQKKDNDNDKTNTTTTTTNIDIILADVGELAQVRRAVLELQGKESKIDAIVCNAGVLLNEKKETSEGNEVTLASHLLVRTYYFIYVQFVKIRFCFFFGKCFSDIMIPNIFLVSFYVPPSLTLLLNNHDMMSGWNLFTGQAPCTSIGGRW